MNQVEAISRGLSWTDYKDIPVTFINLYRMILAVTPLAKYVVEKTDTFEMCCENWFNNQIFDITEKIKEALPESRRTRGKGGKP